MFRDVIKSKFSINLQNISPIEIFYVLYLTSLKKKKLFFFIENEFCPVNNTTHHFEASFVRRVRIILLRQFVWWKRA